jgi:large subunit ribosomal protein L35
MPKMKTKSGAKKRFSLTGTGKIKRRRAYHRHILTKKAMNRKRNLRDGALVHETDDAGVRLMIPYL